MLQFISGPLLSAQKVKSISFSILITERNLILSAFNFCWRAISGFVIPVWSLNPSERRRAETLLKINRKIAVKYSARWILHLNFLNLSRLLYSRALRLSGKSDEYLTDWRAFYFCCKLLKVLAYRWNVRHRFDSESLFSKFLAWYGKLFYESKSNN